MEKFHKGETVVIKSDIYGLKAGERVRIIESSKMPRDIEYCVYPPDGIATWLPESQLEREAESAKKEPEYNEVKRVAKVGEYIKLIKPRYTFDKIGMILPVDAKDEGSVQTRGIHYPCGTYTNAPNANWGHISEEYVVLEGYKPKQNEQKWERRVREVKRRAREGEYIKIIHPYLPMGYSSGSILKVDRPTRFYNRGLNDGVWVWNGINEVMVNDSEYVVLEGYKPEQKGKHSYTDEEIARAKKLVLEMAFLRQRAG